MKLFLFFIFCLLLHVVVTGQVLFEAKDGHVKEIKLDAEGTSLLVEDVSITALKKNITALSNDVKDLLARLETAEENLLLTQLELTQTKQELDDTKEYLDTTIQPSLNETEEGSSLMQLFFAPTWLTQQNETICSANLYLEKDTTCNFIVQAQNLNLLDDSGIGYAFLSNEASLDPTDSGNPIWTLDVDEAGRLTGNVTFAVQVALGVGRHEFFLSSHLFGASSVPLLIAVEVYNITRIPIVASLTGGGNQHTVVGDRDVFTFLSSGSFDVSVGIDMCQVLVVGGGGGGGVGGGGGGQVLYESQVPISVGSYAVVIGNGGGGAGYGSGSCPINGQSSFFGDMEALGGGYGGNPAACTDGGDLGNGGGGCSYSVEGLGGMSIAVPAGYSGGYSPHTTMNPKQCGGGGGGANQAGGDSTTSTAGNGGNGLPLTIRDDSVAYYGGGGGGGCYQTTTSRGTGGLGGGGDGSFLNNAQAGAANTGGGGGGSRNGYSGASGGKGIVIVSCQTS